MNYAMAAPITGNSAGQAARETQVQSQMGRQGELLSKICATVDVLSGRLQPVLRDIPPSPANDSVKGQLALVGHAIALSNQNDQLENLQRRLADIVDRLEL